MCLDAHKLGLKLKDVRVAVKRIPTNEIATKTSHNTRTTKNLRLREPPRERWPNPPGGSVGGFVTRGADDCDAKFGRMRIDFAIGVRRRRSTQRQTDYMGTFSAPASAGWSLLPR